MQKSFKIFGIVVLSVVTLAAVGLVWSYRLSLEPEIDFEWMRQPRDYRILCEWHYPPKDDVPAYVEICYKTGLGIQCYRIKDNQVVNYHHISTIEKLDPSEMQIQMFIQLSKAIQDAQYSSRPSRWEWELLEKRDSVSDMVVYSSFPEGKTFSDIICDMESQIRLYETNTVGYVTMTTGRFLWSWEATAYPLDETPPAFTALRNVFEQYMADPSTREYHTTYIRGYPIPPPENPDHIPVLAAEWDVWKFGCRQRDVVQFLPGLGRVLIPIREGVNPFRKFGVQYVPGNSLIINYRNEDNDTVLYLHGDNFWRVQVYGGEKPTE